MMTLIHDYCLQAKVKEFKEMGWFEILMFYGFREGYDTMMSNDDDDVHLIPSLVERAVLPLVTSLVDNVWEVTSSRQTKPLSQLVSRLMEDYPTVSAESKNTEVCVCVCAYVHVCVRACVVRACVVRACVVWSVCM